MELEARFGLLEDGASKPRACVEARPRFVRALIGAWPDSESRETLRWLESLPHERLGRLCFRLQVRGAVADGLSGQGIKPDSNLSWLKRSGCSTHFPRCSTPRPPKPGPNLRAARLDGDLARRGSSRSASLRPLAVVLRWRAPPRDAAIGRLRPYLRRGLRRLVESVELACSSDAGASSVAGAFVTVVLEVARDPTLPDEAFRWGRGAGSWHFPESTRPQASGWVGTTLDRTPSGLDLLKRLFPRSIASGVGKMGRAGKN